MVPEKEDMVPLAERVVLIALRLIPNNVETGRRQESTASVEDSQELAVENEFPIHLSIYHMFVECSLCVTHYLSSHPSPGDLQMRPVGAVTNYPCVTESPRKWEAQYWRIFVGMRGMRMPEREGRREEKKIECLAFPVSHFLTSQAATSC